MRVGLSHMWFEVTRIRRSHDFIDETVDRLYDDLGNLIEPDALGNDTVTEVRDVVQVAGWAVPNTGEPKLAGHNRRTVDVELYAPPGMFRPQDAVILPGRSDVLEVMGEPENYQHNPFGWQPDLEVVNLGGVT